MIYAKSFDIAVVTFFSFFHVTFTIMDLILLFRCSRIIFAIMTLKSDLVNILVFDTDIFYIL